MFRLFCVVFAAGFFFSCEDYTEERQLVSGGNIDEVLLVVAEDQIDTEFSDTLVWYFTQLYPGLPQAEPRFNVRIKSIQQFLGAGDLLRKYRTIVFASPLNEQNQVSSLIRDKLGEEHLEKSGRDENFFYATQQDVYAAPQLVVYLFAPTTETLVSRLENNLPRFYNVITKHENEQIRAKLFTEGVDQRIIPLLQEQFGISMRVPAPYYLKVQDTNFLWIAKDLAFRDQRGDVVKEVKQNIMIAEFPLDEIDLEELAADTIEGKDLQAYPFILRDRIGRKYVHGSTEANYMRTELREPLYQTVIQLDGVPVMESRGLWRLEDQFMGGPFVNYILKDEEAGRLLMIEVFVYAAGSQKRPLVRELEAIVSTTDLDPEVLD